MTGKTAASGSSTNHFVAMPSPVELLAMAWQDVVACAAEVGIDAEALRGCLPAPGCLLKGREVPVIDKAYRHSCSVLLHINRLPGGDEWPFLRFSTFKHGGVVRDFNGFRWWRGHLAGGSSALGVSPLVMRDPRYAVEQRRREDAERQVRFRRWSDHWERALPMMSHHPWLDRRLAGQADEALLARVDLRVKSNFRGGTVMAALQHAENGLVGYQLLHLDSRDAFRGDLKRLCLPHEGASVGSYVTIRAQGGRQAARQLPTAICEGLVTGLSLALVWPGEIRVGLHAGNLASVRQSLQGPVIFFHDQDVWKPRAGNVGRDKALAAMWPSDRLCGPVFAAGSLEHRPTDFNDLLCLEGRETLRRQVMATFSSITGAGGVAELAACL